MALRSVCLGVLVGIALGCASSRPHSTELYNHVIEFDGDGFTIDPSNGKRLANAREQFSAILRQVQTDLAAAPANQDSATRSSPPCTISVLNRFLQRNVRSIRSTTARWRKARSGLCPGGVCRDAGGTAPKTRLPQISGKMPLPL
jgi:hypothetical protein